MSMRPRGGALIVVLWVVVVLSIIVLNFAAMVQTHLRIAANYADRERLENLAEAGVELALAELVADDNGRDDLTDVWADNPAVFRDVALGDGRLTLIVPPAAPDEPPRYGLADESGKLNLATASRDMLLALPEMTPPLVDALMEWQGRAAASPSAASGEAGNAASLVPSKEAPLDSLDELMLVPGFDAFVVYGEDWNGNGVLDPNEDDGDSTPPRDNADGQLDRGLLPYVTIYSAEKNVSAHGQPRVNLKEADEAALQKGIPGFTNEEAKAVVAWQKGSNFSSVGDLLKVTAPREESGRPPGRREAGTQPAAGGPASPSQGPSNARSGEEKKSSTNDGGKQKETKSSSQASAGSPSASAREQPGGTRGGEEPARRVFSSARVKEIIDYCSTTSDDTCPGRVNLNTAPHEVLRALPGVSESVAEAILDYRTRTPFATIGELLDLPGVTEDVFIGLSELVAVRSYQFRAHAVGTLPGLAARLEINAVLDRSGAEPRVVYWNER